MSKQEQSMAERLDAMLSMMTDRQREIFLARGEGLVEGYKMGKARGYDSSVRSSQRLRQPRPVRQHRTGPTVKWRYTWTNRKTRPRSRIAALTSASR